MLGGSHIFTQISDCEICLFDKIMSKSLTLKRVIGHLVALKACGRGLWLSKSCFLYRTIGRAQYLLLFVSNKLMIQIKKLIVIASDSSEKV